MLCAGSRKLSQSSYNSTGDGRSKRARGGQGGWGQCWTRTFAAVPSSSLGREGFSESASGPPLSSFRFLSFSQHPTAGLLLFCYILLIIMKLWNCHSFWDGQLCIKLGYSLSFNLPFSVSFVCSWFLFYGLSLIYLISFWSYNTTG